MLCGHAFVRACEVKASSKDLLDSNLFTEAAFMCEINAVTHETCVRPHVKLREPKTHFHFCMADNISLLQVINIPLGKQGWLAVGG